MSKEHQMKMDITPEKKVTTTWWLIGFIVLCTATVVTVLSDIKYGITRLDGKMDNVVYTDELERFGTQMLILNPNSHLIVPKQDDYLRRGRKTSALSSPIIPGALVRASVPTSQENN